jgi:hypothetical protein
MKTPLTFVFGFAVLLGGGCTNTRTLSVSPANPTMVTSEQGMTSLRSVKRNAVTVCLLTPQFQTARREFDPPTFRVLVRNDGDKVCDFSPANVTALSGASSVHVFTRMEYCQAINRYEDALLRLGHGQTSLHETSGDGLQDVSAMSLDPAMSKGVSNRPVQEFSEYAAIPSTGASTPQQAAVNHRRKALLDEATRMLVQRTVAPGTMAGGIIKLDPAKISHGQPLKLVVTVGGEAHEFVFEVGS